MAKINCAFSFLAFLAGKKDAADSLNIPYITLDEPCQECVDAYKKGQKKAKAERAKKEGEK